MTKLLRKREICVLFEQNAELWFSNFGIQV